jgi:hypothetical protein
MRRREKAERWRECASAAERRGITCDSMTSMTVWMSSDIFDSLASPLEFDFLRMETMNIPSLLYNTKIKSNHLISMSSIVVVTNPTEGSVRIANASIQRK